MTFSKLNKPSHQESQDNIDSPFQDEAIFSEAETIHAANALESRLVSYEDESPFLQAFADEETPVEQAQWEDSEADYTELDESENLADGEESSEMEDENPENFVDQAEPLVVEQEGSEGLIDEYEDYELDGEDGNSEAFVDESDLYFAEQDEAENLTEWDEAYEPEIKDENPEEFVDQSDLYSAEEDEVENPVDGDEVYEPEIVGENPEDHIEEPVYETGNGLNLERIPPEYEYQLAELLAEETRINPNDTRIDVRAKFALPKMLKRADMKADATRLIEGVNSGQLAGIYGDDVYASVKVANSHNTIRMDLVPKGEDAVLVLDSVNPLVAPPTVIFRGDTPDISKQPERFYVALSKASQTFLLWQHRQIGPCSRPSATPIPNLMPKTFCRIVDHDLLVVVKAKGKPVPGAIVKVIGSAPSALRPLTEPTDAYGKTSFLALAPGAYKVTVKADGYEEAVTTITHPRNQAQNLPISSELFSHQIGTKLTFSLKKQQLVIFKVVNRVLTNESVPQVKIIFSSVIFGSISFTQITDRRGQTKVKTNSLANIHVIDVEPVNPNCRHSGPVGPSLGMPVQGTTVPDRIWESPFTSGLIVKKGRIISASHPDVDVNSANNTVTIKLQPVWMRALKTIRRLQGDEGITRLIILHGTGSTNIQTTADDIRRNAKAHYLIDREGHIIKFINENYQAIHSGPSYWNGEHSLNRFSIGIEMLHRNNLSPNRQIYTRAQYDALLGTSKQPGLLNRIRQTCNYIPPQAVIGHSDVRLIEKYNRLGGKVYCPGVEFDWPLLQRAGLGLRPQRTVNSKSIYNGFFAIVPKGRFQKNDNDKAARYSNRIIKQMKGSKIILELQNDLRSIGYYCPKSGVFDEPTEYTVFMFQVHVFNLSNRNHNLKYPHLDHVGNGWGQVDELTAKRIKEYR